MIRSVFSALGMLMRVILALVLIAVLALVAFVAYKGSQPMEQDGANGMTYWQFMRERIGAIRELPAKCQQMHFTGYLCQSSDVNAPPIRGHNAPVIFGNDAPL